MLNSRDVVATVEIIVYIPLAVLALINCFRHGFRRSSGWIYTVILCVVRIAGAVCQFISHTDSSNGLVETMVILDSVGLSPLLLASLGLLHRFVDFINGQKPAFATTRVFRLLQVVITIGLILSIVGGTSTNVQPDGSIQTPESSKIGVIIFIIAFVGISLVLLTSLPYSSRVPTSERRIPIAISLALPFILIRLVYSACVVFLHNHTFNILTGSLGVRVGMAIVEEFVVIGIYVALGFTLKNTGDYPVQSVGMENYRSPAAA